MTNQRNYSNVNGADRNVLWQRGCAYSGMGGLSFTRDMGIFLERMIGQRLRKLREMRGLTQKGLAAKIQGGIDYSYIGKIERGEQLPSLKVLRRIAETLDVPLSLFFQEEEPILLPKELRKIMKDEAKMTLLRQLSTLRRSDISLLIEIAKVLDLHHRAQAGGAALTGRGAYGKVAEARRPYERETATIGKVRGALKEIEGLLTAGGPWPEPQATKALEAVAQALEALKKLPSLRRPGGGAV